MQLVSLARNAWIKAGIVLYLAVGVAVAAGLQFAISEKPMEDQAGFPPWVFAIVVLAWPLVVAMLVILHARGF